MIEFWLDSDVLIWSKDNAYRLNAPHAKHFWQLLERGLEEGLIKITRRNFVEMTEGRDKITDELAIWLQTQQERSPKNVGVSPSKEVQQFAKAIGAYIYSNPVFLLRWNNEFSRGADSWLIAQAAVNKAVVITRETTLQPNAKRPIIPNLCKYYGVTFMSMFDMLDQLESALSKPLPGHLF
jgi:hypothetical protein